MALNQKRFDYGLDHTLRDTRPMFVRIYDAIATTDMGIAFVALAAFACYFPQGGLLFLDIALIFAFFYTLWLVSRDKSVTFKLPATAKCKDANNTGPGKNMEPEGILYLGNTKPQGEEIWFTNSDARTHILYLGTTGAGKTQGLKSMVSNALCWGSGFIYVDGKADTDLWSDLSSLVRRFGRDDDLFVLNYMTGNSDERAPSNSLNPFASGSASYLTNMLVSLMPVAEGDNAMWKERAVSLLGSLMPALTYKRDKLGEPMNISTIRNYLNFDSVIRLSRDDSLPEKIRESIKGYLDTLPGYAEEAFDDNGKDKPMGPDQPMVDTQVPKQQHGYLSMQFTRSLQSLGDDYGYIFDAEYADIDMRDIVLNRRILVVLIPALEKSGDETANLGKIIAATLKGMMGSTLGAQVEGETSKTIDNKPTHSATPFMTVFDEVGYYTAQGMAVMAAQARSLGFCLIYASQDLPAMEKLVKEEARSITANCNIKIFGKLEDPTDTKDFFEKTVGQALVTEVSSFSVESSGMTGSYLDAQSAGVTLRGRSSYDELRSLKEGGAVMCFGDKVNTTQIFYSDPGKSKAMRVTRYLGLAKQDENVLKQMHKVRELRDCLVKKEWTAANADTAVKPAEDLANIIEGLKIPVTAEAENPGLVSGAMALAHFFARKNPDALDTAGQPEVTNAKPQQPSPSASSDKKPLSWSDIIGDDDTEDDEETGSNGNGGSSAVKPGIKQVPADQYDAQKATEALHESGDIVLPEGLSENVQNILKEAAQSIKSGLFSKPTLPTDPGIDDVVKPDAKPAQPPQTPGGSRN